MTTSSFLSPFRVLSIQPITVLIVIVTIQIMHLGLSHQFLNEVISNHESKSNVDSLSTNVVPPASPAMLVPDDKSSSSSSLTKIQQSSSRDENVPDGNNNHQVKKSQQGKIINTDDDETYGHGDDPKKFPKSTQPNIAQLAPIFHRYDNVAVVTKVHWPNDVYRMKRMLCLFHAAYNQFVNYDIIVFTTIPWPRDLILELQTVVPNSNLKVVIDGPSTTGNIQDYLFDMTQDEIQALKNRCGAGGSTSNSTLEWSNYCREDINNVESYSALAYNWQSEFRAYHIYKHHALKPYKYMIWMDSDALCTKSWTVDPIKIMVDNDLTVLFPNFPAGKTEHPLLLQNIIKAYNESVCHAILNKEGFLWGKRCNKKVNETIPHFQHIHGFHHITNLDVYRQEHHLKFLRSITVENYRFSRLWDDQLGVTVPAVMDKPGKAWDYWQHNITTNIFHHGDLDGKGKGNMRDYNRWWKKQGSSQWDIGREMCDLIVLDERVNN